MYTPHTKVQVTKIKHTLCYTTQSLLQDDMAPELKFKNGELIQHVVDSDE